MDNRNLSDNELEQVNGGGMVPAAGITFSAYSTVEANHYYAAVSGDFSNIAYVYQTDGSHCAFSTERFTVSGDTWSSRAKLTDSSGIFEFKQRYRYVLNVQP